MKNKSNRRNFIGNVTKAGFIGLLPGIPSTRNINLTNTRGIEGRNLLLTMPYLQNLTPESCTVMWITARACLSWVEYGPDKELGQKAEAIHIGLIDVNNGVNKIRIPGLQPNTAYRYRVCSREIIDFKPYSLVWGETEKSDLFSFHTPDLQAKEVSWIVLNDIHDRPASFPLLFSLLGNDTYDFAFLNGDMFDYQTDQQQMIDHLLAPLANLLSSKIPFLYTRGNHETRGKFAREHYRYFDNPGDRYYFSFTQGPVHFVVLDTGEDKEDNHQEYGGLVAFDAYREEQAKWLEKEIQTESFKKAPFRVVMMHIPLYESGDWHGTKHCRQLFNPLFNKGKIDLLICGHTHRYGTYAADQATHNYPLVIGGGPLEGKRTIIKVKADRKNLELIMLRDDGVQVGHVQVKSKLAKS